MASKFELMEGGHVHIIWAQNVKNMKELVKATSTSCAIIKTSLVVEPFNLIIAANRAHMEVVRETSKTKEVHAELVYGLASSNHIPTALRQGAASPSDTAAFIVMINAGEEAVSGMQTSVEGDITPLPADGECFGSHDEAALMDKSKIKAAELTLLSGSRAENTSNALTCLIASKGIAK